MIVYVNIPAHCEAGGVESLYQLVDAINQQGGDARVLWDGKVQQVSYIPPRYAKYNIKTATEIIDHSSNWIIYPEVWTQWIDHTRKLKKAIWWLSVDNCYKSQHGNFKSFHDSSITHFYQSQYAEMFLKQQAAPNVYPLYDYISDYYHQFTYDVSKKLDIICYNPAKGFETTKEIINNNPDLNFESIRGLSQEGVASLLIQSKIYIDFGEHPGRDRIPREAALLGNCIITGLRGSAAYLEDMPILARYKYYNTSNLGSFLRACLSNYNQHILNFKDYQTAIKQQKSVLFSQVSQYFR